ncbi:MAG: saccharopine dehydrogenase C-terminal domain-containing protein [Minisyncoccales bacterium]
MDSDFIVLGADGMQGTIVCRFLLEKGYRLLGADISDIRISPLLSKYKKEIIFDFLDVRDFDRLLGFLQKSSCQIVINCVESDWNLIVLRACLLAKKNYLDLGSDFKTTLQQFKLHNQFKKNKIIAITGCGSVPGIGNVMLAFLSKKFDSIKSIDLGFAWDSNFKKFVVPFSIESILDEYTQKAPYFKSGRLRYIKPSNSVKVRYFRQIGRQKIFLADHPETYTFFHYFKSWGLKNVRFFASFPCHSEKVIKLLESFTLAQKKPILFEEKKIVPVRFLSQVLKRMKIPRGYKEWENLWLEVKGSEKRKRKKILMECIVPPLKGWEKEGCNIDTGFPAALIAEMVKYGEIKDYGVFAPEACVPPKLLFKRLSKYKFSFFKNDKKIRF